MATLLAITIFIPMIGCILLAVRPGLDSQESRRIGLGFALASLAVGLIFIAAFDPARTTPQFAFGPEGGPYGWRWLPAPGPDVRLAFGLDGLSLWLFVLTPLLTVTSIFASWEPIRERAAAHYAFLLALETGLLGLFASLDVVLFYVFFEFALVPLFFLIGLWGGPERRRAAVTFFLYTLAGSLLTLLGVIALIVVHYQFTPDHVLTFSIPDLTRGLALVEWPEWRETTSWTSPQVAIFLLLLAGFAVKVPMFPVHTWLPLAHVEAPTAGSILLAGVLLKVGSYGLMRFNMAMTPLGAASLFSLLAALSVAGVVYGALASLAQTDAKRLVAYSSVSHMGFITLGIFSMNATGMDGAMIQMLNHGVTTGALFACVGVFYDRYHTREMDEVGGLWNRMPLLAFFMILAALGSAAVPGLNGFVGEFPILAGMFAESRRASVLAASGMILGATYLLWMVKKVVFGPLHEPSEHAHEVPSGETHSHVGPRPIGWYEIAGLAPLMFLIAAIGVFPSFFLDRISPAVAPISSAVQSQRRLTAERPRVEPRPLRSDSTSTAGLGLATTASTLPDQKGR